MAQYSGLANRLVAMLKVMAVKELDDIASDKKWLATKIRIEESETRTQLAKRLRNSRAGNWWNKKLPNVTDF